MDLKLINFIIKKTIEKKNQIIKFNESNKDTSQNDDIGNKGDKGQKGDTGQKGDIRDKLDVRDTILGLDFINKLRPVDFKWNYRENYKNIESDNNNSIIKEIENDGSKTRKRYHHGLIAQDIQNIIAETGIDFGGFQDHTINNGQDVLSIGYSELIAPLIKSIQELTISYRELNNKILKLNI